MGDYVDQRGEGRNFSPAQLEQLGGKLRLTFEEFAWRCEWLECGRLAQWTTEYYVLKKVRDLKRRAKRGELWQKPYYEQSEWAGMVRRWYAEYLRTGEL